jgi:3-deoxy-7-phosphoheptulonate synthase
MLVLMSARATDAQIQAVADRIRELGFTPHVMPGAETTAIGITGNRGPLPEGSFAGLEGISRAISVTQPFKLVSREMKAESTVIAWGDVQIGGDELLIMAGPCSVESREQILASAAAAHAAGAQFLRGGAFKPRTSPYDFQGMKEDGLKLLDEARQLTGLRIVTEVKDTETVEMVARYADLLQVGARNMQNYSLLEALGDLRQPVLLKRGMSATIKELLMAAEYIFNRGNHEIILCERGIRTFETMTRNTMDVGAIPVLKRLTHLPVVADPSHGIGIASDVPALSSACVAAGCDGLIVEMHPDPPRAMSDGAQSVTPETLVEMVNTWRRLAPVVGRSVRPAPAPTN